MHISSKLQKQRQNPNHIQNRKTHSLKVFRFNLDSDYAPRKCVLTPILCCRIAMLHPHHRNKAAVHIFRRQRKYAQRNNLCVTILMQRSRKSVLRMVCRSARRCNPVKKRSCRKAAVMCRANRKIRFCRLLPHRQKRNLPNT